jgi:plasmid stabilization system protein ParE
VNGCQRIVITEPAKIDLEEGFWFYEEQQAGLGDYFLSSLQSDIDSLLIFAGVHAKPYQNRVFRALSRNFPYAVFYSLQQDTAQIVAVLDTRSDPSQLKQRLQATP